MELILPILMMITMSIAFSFYIAHRALKRNINTITFIAKNSSEYPYDWKSEEAFEDIANRFNK
jgi:hypothetical protein